MAAAVSALNAKIRSHPVLNYVCSTRKPTSPAQTPLNPDRAEARRAAEAGINGSTDFFGPVSNFGIPIAAVLDTQKDPELISGRMTGALLLYSSTFMRYSFAVTPKNYLLFACHFVNFGAQTTQAVRFMKYWNYGGREASLQAQVQQGLRDGEAEGKRVLAQVEEKGKGLVDEARRKAHEVADKVVR